MDTDETPEDLLKASLARCTASIAGCLTNAEDRTRYYRGDEMRYAGQLLSASARLADALARLKGQTVRVIREGVPPDQGSNRERRREPERPENKSRREPERPENKRRREPERPEKNSEKK
jgi:hypothetical protein